MREELRLTAPRPAVLAGLVPDPEVPQPARVPAELDGRAGSRVADPRTPFWELRDREQAASRTVERPAIAALAASRRGAGRSGQRGAAGGGNGGPSASLSSYASPAGSSISTSGSRSSSPSATCSSTTSAAGSSASTCKRATHLGTRELERAHEREPVTAPLEASRVEGSDARTSQGSFEARPWKPCSTSPTRHDAPAFGAASCQPPRYEAVHTSSGRSPAHRSLRGERWTAEHPPAGRHVDQLEDLRTVDRIDEREQLLRAKDDHGVGRLGAASRRRRV